MKKQARLHTRIHRRNFLRGVGLATVSLPFLEGLPERSAWAADENPIFGLFIVTANGVVQGNFGEPERFWPTQTGALTTEGMQASAAERCTGMLAEHAERLLIVRGVNYPFGNSGCGHAQGLAQCLTASRPMGNAQNAVASGMSADVYIANALTPGVEPLTLYAGMKQGYIDEKLSFSGPGQVRAAEGNPWNVYQRLMGMLGTGVADELAVRRKSVNDLVREELNDLRTRPELSQADRDRLDMHFTAIRDLETGMMGMGAACTDAGLDISAIQAMNTGSAFSQDGQIEEVAKLQMQLVGLTFSCNAARVATLQVGDGTDQTHYTIDGQRLERFHWISHRVQSDGSSGAPIANAVQLHAQIDRLRMETFKFLLDSWAQYTTANGSLFDNAFALWTCHCATGSHSFNNLPIIVAGNAGGFLKQGQYVDAGGTTNNRLLNTLITAIGVRDGNGNPIENFGGGGQPGLIGQMLA